MSERPTPDGGVRVLMPAYNLAGSIGSGIERVARAMEGIPGTEIIVADDGSSDGTMEKAAQAAAGLEGVTVVGHSPNRGKGAALQAAFAVSTGETIVFLDGDLDLPPEQVPGFVEQFQAAGTDILVGAKRSAMAPGRYPLLRRVLSRAFALVVRLLFRLPVAETQTGLKAFRRGPLSEVLPGLRVMRYTFDLELLVALKRRGATMTEASVELSEGASDTGVSVGTLWEMGRDTLRIWIRTLFRRV
jgi:glycosyltransferase involved in cell wall biosynthesis